MMERTDRHFRFLMRLMSPNARLYTEMITSSALLRGDRGRLLAYDAIEHPVAIQLGGNDPAALAECAAIAAAAGYDEVNLNVGCPSPRVQAGMFGAALMLDPGRVAECVAAMCEASAVPVTVKTRIGVDEHDDYEVLRGLTERVVAAGAVSLIVHARKAWLEGLSPKQNREIPPLDYPRVYRLKGEFPDLPIFINGGFTTEAEVLAQRGKVDGVMLGRSAYHEPMLIARLDRLLYRDLAMGVSGVDARGSDARGSDPEGSDPEGSDPRGSDPKGSDPDVELAVLRRYVAYMQRELAAGTPATAMTRHLTGLFKRRPGARHWRQRLSELSAAAGGIEQLIGELTSKPTRSRYNAESAGLAAPN